MSHNPKDAAGRRKFELSTIPPNVLALLSVAMKEGELKYGFYNYRETPVSARVYYDAAMRHMISWYHGEDNDPDSGLPHPVKAMACMAIIVDGLMYGRYEDDRPSHATDLCADTDGINELVGELLDKYGVGDA